MGGLASRAAGRTRRSPAPRSAAMMRRGERDALAGRIEASPDRAEVEAQVRAAIELDTGPVRDDLRRLLALVAPAAPQPGRIPA